MQRQHEAVVGSSSPALSLGHSILKTEDVTITGEMINCVKIPMVSVTVKNPAAPHWRGSSTSKTQACMFTVLKTRREVLVQTDF